MGWQRRKARCNLRPHPSRSTPLSSRPNSPRTAGLILAAGAGTRLGEPKAPLVVGGERLVDRMVRVLAEAGCSPVIVVLGAWQGAVPEATVVMNEAWSTGMGSSLRVGLAWLIEHEPDVERVAITPVDLPGLTWPAVERLLRHSEPVVTGAYAGVRGHPVLIARQCWDQAIAMAEGDRGARDFLAMRPDLVLVELGDVASGHDVDTREDLAQFDRPAQP